jgi:hypothetical protein
MPDSFFIACCIEQREWFGNGHSPMVGHSHSANQINECAGR